MAKPTRLYVCEWPARGAKTRHGTAADDAYIGQQVKERGRCVILSNLSQPITLAAGVSRANDL
jgi:hypothetical protein